MAVVVVIGVVVVAALAIAAVTFMVQRQAASNMVQVDADLAESESESGKCGACLGTGYVWENLGGRGQGRTRSCWRCGGSGLPPTAEDRARFMPY